MSLSCSWISPLRSATWTSVIGGRRLPATLLAASLSWGLNGIRRYAATFFFHRIFGKWPSYTCVQVRALSQLPANWTITSDISKTDVQLVLSPPLPEAAHDWRKSCCGLSPSVTQLLIYSDIPPKHEPSVERLPSVWRDSSSALVSRAQVQHSSSSSTAPSSNCWRWKEVRSPRLT
jgi:hypothetical protein